VVLRIIFIFQLSNSKFVKEPGSKLPIKKTFGGTCDNQVSVAVRLTHEMSLSHLAEATSVQRLLTEYRQENAQRNTQDRNTQIKIKVITQLPHLT